MAKSSRTHKTKAELYAELDAIKIQMAQMTTAQAEAQLAVMKMRESEQKYRMLLDESSDPIFSFNRDGQYQYVNRAFSDGVGKKLEEIRDKRIWDVFPQDEADKRYAVVKWVFANQVTKVFEVRVPREDGDRYYITTAKPVFNELGEVVSVICISKEITERKQMEEELIRLSTQDTLTGLYNRNFFEAELDRLQHSRMNPISIVVIDMDHLKVVNDRYGHNAGDRLLQRLAQCMRASFRNEDVIARIGGDEFAVLLPHTDEVAAAAAIERLHDQLVAVNDPLLQLSVGMSTGMDSNDLHEIMRAADDRMYQEKFAKRKAPTET